MVACRGPEDDNCEFVVFIPTIGMKENKNDSPCSREDEVMISTNSSLKAMPTTSEGGNAELVVVVVRVEMEKKTFTNWEF